MIVSFKTAGALRQSIDVNVRRGIFRPLFSGRPSLVVRQPPPQNNHVTVPFLRHHYPEHCFTLKFDSRTVFNSYGARQKRTIDGWKTKSVPLLHWSSRQARHLSGGNGFAGASPSLAGAQGKNAEKQEEEATPPASRDPATIAVAAGGVGRTLKQVPLQKILGITDTEVETLKGMATTSGPGFENLVATTGEGEGTTTSPSSFATYLLDDLAMEPKDVKAVVFRHSSILSRSHGVVNEVSEWLQKDMGLSQADVARLLVRFPEAGHLSVEHNLKPTVTWLCEKLETDSQGLAKLLRHAPQVLGRSIEGNLAPKLLWLEERLRISAKRAAKIGRKYPVLFVYSIKNKLEPTLSWLQQRLRIEDENKVLAMVAMAPTILCHNVETGIEPKLAWLRDRLGLTPEEICTIVCSHPPVLVRSVEKSLEPKVVWLMDNLGLNAEDVKVMLLRCPTITGAGLEGNLKLKLPLLQAAFGFTHAEVVALVKRAPMLLSLSIKGNLEPTVAFFRGEMQASNDELSLSVLRNPQILRSSLDKQLRPRVAAMKKAGIKPLFSKHCGMVATWPPEKFRKFIETALEGDEM